MHPQYITCEKCRLIENVLEVQTGCNSSFAGNHVDGLQVAKTALQHAISGNTNWVYGHAGSGLTVDSRAVYNFHGVGVIQFEATGNNPGVLGIRGSVIRRLKCAFIGAHHRHIITDHHYCAQRHLAHVVVRVRFDAESTAVVIYDGKLTRLAGGILNDSYSAGRK